MVKIAIILAAARERASNGFENCITYASKAKEEMVSIEARIDDFIAQHQSGVENDQNDTTAMSYRELGLALRKHLEGILIDAMGLLILSIHRY
mmetsp:Transcript_24594/g.36450  ORF Transcript_24594/g.36450 Transcript_24594/m.36450 type:complete len:93 (-) Transcript_24594:517-795(-)